METIAILFALRRESAPFVRRLCPPALSKSRARNKRLSRPLTSCAAPVGVWQRTSNGRTILVLETGIGCAAAAAVTSWLLDNHPVSQVIAAGFAGALDAKLRVGHVIVAE